jgi:hypothetical protein
MSIDIHPSTHFGTLRLEGEITEEVALQFEAALDLLFGYYQYKRITLEINSRGGQVVALELMLAGLERWRALGRQVSTRARFRAASAAAMLLGMGDIGSRSASASTSLLFHSARIDGANATFTATAASSLGALLQCKDQFHLGRLIEHQVQGFGGSHALATEGAARCRRLADRSGRRASKSADQPPVPLFGALPRTFAQCLERRSVEPYRRMLSRRFAEDRPMHTVEAWALCLLDSIVDRPDLRPSHKHVTTAPDEPAISHSRPVM